MSDIIIGLAGHSGRASEIHEVLCAAFEPYRMLYTPQAYADTVRTAEVFEERIVAPDVDVIIAERENEIVGTACTKLVTDDELYFFSMAVKPEGSGKGVGYMLLEKIESIAREKECRAVSLETCPFLVRAISLYERFGFVKTGGERDYSGNTVLEMKKYLT
jgi:ribosomal protein S18 acetylase RimI-like enzyme